MIFVRLRAKKVTVCSKDSKETSRFILNGPVDCISCSTNTKIVAVLPHFTLIFESKGKKFLKESYFAKLTLIHVWVIYVCTLIVKQCKVIKHFLICFAVDFNAFFQYKVQWDGCPLTCSEVMPHYIQPYNYVFYKRHLTPIV